MSTGWQEYYKANREKILKRQKAWYRKNKSSSRKKMTDEERRMAKNECEARELLRLVFQGKLYPQMSEALFREYEEFVCCGWG